MEHFSGDQGESLWDRSAKNGKWSRVDVRGYVVWNYGLPRDTYVVRGEQRQVLPIM